MLEFRAAILAGEAPMNRCCVGMALGWPGWHFPLSSANLEITTSTCGARRDRCIFPFLYQLSPDTLYRQKTDIQRLTDLLILPAWPIDINSSSSLRSCSLNFTIYFFIRGYLLAFSLRLPLLFLTCQFFRDGSVANMPVLW